MSQVRYCKKTETAVNRLISLATQAAEKQLAKKEALEGPVGGKVERDDLFSALFHAEMDRLAKAKGLRV